MSPYENQRVRYYGHLRASYGKLGTVVRVFGDLCDVRLDNGTFLVVVRHNVLRDATDDGVPATLDETT